MKATEDIQIELFNKIGVKLREFDEKHGWIDYFIAPVIVTVILLVVYAIKGVYPFGVNTIAYYDMTSNGVPGYTYLWDELHGKAGIFINWMFACGASNAGGLASFINPFNVFFIFVPRDKILFAFSIFLMIKMALCAFSMSFYFKRHFNDTVGTVCAGILYACCGYIIQYYNNIFFLYFAFFFPLLVYFLEKLVNERKYLGFTILMFFIVTQNIQFVFMICIYLVFKSYILITDLPQERRGDSIRMLAISIVVSGLLASVCIVPSVSQLSQSARVTNEGGFNYFDSMKTVYNSFRRQKHLIMYGSEIAVGLFMVLLIRGKKVISKYSKNLTMIFLLGLPILHEGINLIWHAGSYKHFPVRFGYMLTFECLVFWGQYIKDEEPINIKYISKAAKIIGVSAIPFISYVLFKFFEQFTLVGIGDLGVYGSYWIYFVTLSVAYFISFFSETDGSRKFMLISLVLVQAVCGIYGLIAPEEAQIGNYRVQYITNAIELKKAFVNETDLLARIKADPSEYESDYSLIVGQPSIAYWSNGASGTLEEVLQNKMGYDGLNTYVMDSGGTAFTDALLGMKWYAGSRNPDGFLYDDDDTKDEVYPLKYTLPAGLIADKNGFTEDSSVFEYNNKLFSFLTGINEELINHRSAKECVYKKNKLSTVEIADVRKIFDADINGREKNYIVANNGAEEDFDKDTEEPKPNTTDDEIIYEHLISIPIEESKSLYLYASDDFGGTLEFLLNGKPVRLDSMMTYLNYNYPYEIRRGILALGSYKDQTVEIRAYTSKESIEDVQIGLLDLEKLRKGIELIRNNQDIQVSCDRNKMRVTGTVKTEGALFLPVAYSQNWHAKINGITTSVNPFINDSFVSVNVPKGDIEIEFTYIPKGLIGGIVFSIFGLLVGILLVIFERHGGITGRKYECVINKVFLYTFYAVVFLLFMVMYVVPVWIKMSL